VVVGTAGDRTDDAIYAMGRWPRPRDRVVVAGRSSTCVSGTGEMETSGGPAPRRPVSSSEETPNDCLPLSCCWDAQLPGGSAIAVCALEQRQEMPMRSSVAWPGDDRGGGRERVAAGGLTTACLRIGNLVPAQRSQMTDVACRGGDVSLVLREQNYGRIAFTDRVNDVSNATAAESSMHGIRPGPVARTARMP